MAESELTLLFVAIEQDASVLDGLAGKFTELGEPATGDLDSAHRYTEEARSLVARAEVLAQADADGNKATVAELRRSAHDIIKQVRAKAESAVSLAVGCRQTSEEASAMIAHRMHTSNQHVAEQAVTASGRLASQAEQVAEPIQEGLDALPNADASSQAYYHPMHMFYDALCMGTEIVPTIKVAADSLQAYVAVFRNGGSSGAVMIPDRLKHRITGAIGLSSPPELVAEHLADEPAPSAPIDTDTNETNDESRILNDTIHSATVEGLRTFDLSDVVKPLDEHTLPENIDNYGLSAIVAKRPGAISLSHPGEVITDPDVVLNEKWASGFHFDAQQAIGITAPNDGKQEVVAIVSAGVDTGQPTPTVLIDQIQLTQPYGGKGEVVNPGGALYGIDWRYSLVRAEENIAKLAGAKQIVILGAVNSKYSAVTGYTLPKELQGRTDLGRLPEERPARTVNYDDVAERMGYTPGPDGNWYKSLK